MSKERAVQRSHAQWDGLVDEWLESGQTQQQFCVTRDINPKTFQGQVWRSRQRRGILRKGKQRPCRFVEVTPSERKESKPVGECRITISTTCFEFSSSSDAGLITQIMSRLEQIR